MPNERTLLERLSKPKGAGNRTLHEDTRELTRSILRNLQKLLNTRMGNAEAQMDLGTPAPCEMILMSAEGLNGVVKALRACIEKYEPRLEGVDVAYIESDDDVLTLRFQVTARVATSKDGASISFDTTVDPSGRIKLQG
jgi:type VI secretion system protein